MPTLGLCEPSNQAGKLGSSSISKQADQDAVRITLGQKLFNDQRLSADGTVSCATCHVPSKAFTDGLPVARGIHGQLSTRNTPTILNAALATLLFWDGRRRTLEEQALDPLVNSREHGLSNHQSVLDIVRKDRAYALLFNRAFGVKPAKITISQVTQALARFERSLYKADTPFDRYYNGGDQQAIPKAAIRGLNLFQGQARCATCHLVEEKSAPFTDNQFHSLGVGYQKIEPRLAEITTRLVHSNGKPLDQNILSDDDISELGRFAVTLKPSDIAKFRTPSLRNVALTAPYMHDGSVATLEEAVELEIYYRGVEQGRPLILTPAEKADLIAFLHTLNSQSTQMFVQGSNSQ